MSDGVCQFAPGGLLLRHTYPLGDGFIANVRLEGPNFGDLEGQMHLGTFEERNETLFVSFNVGLADTQVDYYSSVNSRSSMRSIKPKPTYCAYRKYGKKTI